MRTPRRLAVSALLSLLGVVSTNTIVGCGANNAPAATGTPAKNLFEYDYGTNTIDEFLLSSTGTPVATATLALPSNFQFDSLTQDPTGKVYVAGANTTTNTIHVLVFASGTTSFSTPTATITIGSTTEPDYIAADSSGNVYVCGTGSTYYEYNASGSLIRMLTQPAYTSGCDSAMAVDTAGNFYISGYNGTTNLNEIDVVPAGAPSGNITPSRTLTFPGRTFAGALAVDSTGNLYAGLETYPYNVTATSIEVFNATSSTPIRTINVPAQPAGFSQESGENLSVDSAGYIYTLVENFTPGSTTVINPFYGFAPGATTPSITFNLAGEPYGYFFVQ